MFAWKYVRNKVSSENIFAGTSFSKIFPEEPRGT
jgi:hypothetical protein